MKLLTPPGIAGIAVVRAEPAERLRLQQVLRTPDGGALSLGPGVPPRRAVLQIGGCVVDDVLVVDRGPLGVEVNVHGSPAVLDALGQAFDVTPARPSSPAEQLLQQALTREQLELSVEQMGFDFAQFCRQIHDLPSPERAEQLSAARWRTQVARAHVEPRRLVLVGAQNAGKSSLFNLLLFRERVLTGPQPGLTRDPVAECTALDGYPYEIFDTAGEGAVLSPIDARALALARERRAGALLLLLVDRAVGPSALDRALAPQVALVVANKCDLPAAPWPEDVPCHLQLACAGGDAALVRRDIGLCLRLHRGLPVAGGVGGAAALTALQASLLDEAGEAGSRDPEILPSH